MDSKPQLKQKALQRYGMYKIINGAYQINGFESLDAAMEYARSTETFVTIMGPNDFEVCGMFGVDSIVDGMCPDGVAYDWDNSSRIGATKR